MSDEKDPITDRYEGKSAFRYATGRTTDFTEGDCAWCRYGDHPDGHKCPLHTEHRRAIKLTQRLSLGVAEPHLVPVGQDRPTRGTPYLHIQGVGYFHANKPYPLDEAYQIVAELKQDLEYTKELLEERDQLWGEGERFLEDFAALFDAWGGDLTFEAVLKKAKKLVEEGSRALSPGDLAMSTDPYPKLVPRVAHHGPYEFVRWRKDGLAELKDRHTGDVLPVGTAKQHLSLLVPPA